MVGHTKQSRQQAEDRALLDGFLWRFVGMRLADAEAATATQLRSGLQTLDRLLARERNKGVARHWSYDLNRHVSLKRARDGLLEMLRERAEPTDDRGINLAEDRRRPDLTRRKPRQAVRRPKAAPGRGAPSASPPGIQNRITTSS